MSSSAWGWKVGLAVMKVKRSTDPKEAKHHPNHASITYRSSEEKHCHRLNIYNDIHTCICVSMHMYVFMYAYICVCMQICTYTSWYKNK